MDSSLPEQPGGGEELPEHPDDIAASVKVNDVLWLDEPERIVSHQKEMQAAFEGRLNCFASAPGLFEFVALEATKASALEKIGLRLGVAREETAAIGDGYNDLPMLRYAGLSIAMGNAPDAVKAACSHVTLGNGEDGVAAWIEGQL